MLNLNIMDLPMEEAVLRLGILGFKEMELRLLIDAGGGCCTNPSFQLSVYDYRRVAGYADVVACEVWNRRTDSQALRFNVVGA